MTTPRTLAGALLIGLIPLSIGCSSESKATNRWAGKTYLVNIPDDNWKRPKGEVGSEFGQYIPKFLLQVKNDSVVVGAGDAAGNQDLCSPTIEIPTSTPEKLFGPVDTKLHVKNDVGSAVVAPLYGMTFTDILTDTPEAAILQGAFDAKFDLRDIYQLITQLGDPTPQSLCDFLYKSYETTCSACPNDGEPYCTELKAVNLAGVPLTGVSVQTVSSTGLSTSCTAIVASDAGT